MKKRFWIWLGLGLALCLCAAADSCGHDQGWQPADAQTHVCRICAMQESHHFRQEKVEATCTGVGYTMDVCPVCGYVGDQYDIVPASEDRHVYGEWIHTENSTCEKAGEQVCECLICGKQKRESLPLVEHTWRKETHEPDCMNDGYTQQVCVVCGAEGEKTDITPHSAAYHIWREFEIIEEPGCVRPGQQERTCALCGAKHRQEIPPVGHEGREGVKKPTCLEDGYCVMVCALCGEEISERYDVIPASPEYHRWEKWRQVKESTCVEWGQWVCECAICGEEETVAEAPLPHEPTERKVSSTFVSEGYSVLVCAVCGQELSERWDRTPAGITELPEDAFFAEDAPSFGAERAQLRQAVSPGEETASILTIYAGENDIVRLDTRSEWFLAHQVCRVEIVWQDITFATEYVGEFCVQTGRATEKGASLLSLRTSLPVDGFDETAGKYTHGVYAAALSAQEENAFAGRLFSVRLPAGPGSLLVAWEDDEAN